MKTGESSTSNLTPTDATKSKTPMTEGHSTNSELPTSAYIAGSLNGIGLSIYDNIVQYLGVLLGSAGLIQGLITSLRQ